MGHLKILVRAIDLEKCYGRVNITNCRWPYELKDYAELSMNKVRLTVDQHSQT